MNKLRVFAGILAVLMMFSVLVSAAPQPMPFTVTRNWTTGIYSGDTTRHIMSANITGPVTHVYIFGVNNRTMYEVNLSGGTRPIFNTSLDGASQAGACGLNASYTGRPTFVCSNTGANEGTNFTFWNDTGGQLGVYRSNYAGITELTGLWTNATNSSTGYWFGAASADLFIYVFNSTFALVQNISTDCNLVTGGIWSNASYQTPRALWVGCASNRTVQEMTLTGQTYRSINKTIVMGGTELGVFGNFTNRPAGFLYTTNITGTMIQEIFNDTVPPIFDPMAINDTYVGTGEGVGISVTVSDLGRAFYAWIEDNSTGVMRNRSESAAVLGLGQNFSFRRNLNFSLSNATLCDTMVTFRVIANDTAGNENATPYRNYTAMPFVLSGTTDPSTRVRSLCGSRNDLNLTYPMNAGQNYTVLMPRVNRSGINECAYNVSFAQRVRITNGSQFCQLNVSSARTTTIDTIIISSTLAISFTLPPNVPAAIALAVVSTIIVVARIVRRRNY